LNEELKLAPGTFSLNWSIFYLNSLILAKVLLWSLTKIHTWRTQSSTARSGLEAVEIHLRVRLKKCTLQLNGDLSDGVEGKSNREEFVSSICRGISSQKQIHFLR